MTPRLLSNVKGSEDTFYRIQKPRSGTKPYPIDYPDIAFLAGACAANLPTQYFKPEDQKAIVEAHSLWSAYQPRSPLISTTEDESWALYFAEEVICVTEGLTLNQIDIAVIRPGLVASESMKYYHWLDLAQDLGAEIQEKSRNVHEYVFLRSIPHEAIQFYGTVEEYINRSDDESQMEGTYFIFVSVIHTSFK